eukprot:Sro31_g020360.2  (362) ;mRNA; r:100899-102137
MLRRKLGTRTRMLQVLDADGDKDLSSREDKEAHFVSTCLSVHRYFQQKGSNGFKKDMSTKLLNCIAQDNGGDSVAALQNLERLFFDYDFDDRNRIPDSIRTQRLSQATFLSSVVDVIQKTPILVSKFCVPKDFFCKGFKKNLPGYARFMEWNQPAEFVSLEEITDPELEKSMEERWRADCNTPKKATFWPDDFTAMPASMSMDGLEGKGGEGLVDTSSNNDDTEEEDSSGSEDCSDDEQSQGSDEGDDALHAMVMLGTRLVGGKRYWLIQNSWADGGMQLLEMSTEYLQESGAVLNFFDEIGRHLKTKESLSVPVQLCPSPIAESSQLERSDCGNWGESLLFEVGGKRGSAAERNASTINM